MTATGSIRRLAIGSESLERPVWWGVVGALIVGYGAVPIVGGGFATPRTYVLAIGVLSALAAIARGVTAGGFLACVALAFGPLGGALVGVNECAPGPQSDVLGRAVPVEALGGSIPASIGVALAAALAIGVAAVLLGELGRLLRGDR
ncbi:hypothetical protein ACFQAS_02695 [Halopenitus salinus]|uniref:Uncharacterized protein n=1 Tax=Halopenitus salinus TaxID=1198295 RepID=A0ABD5URR4_9EURY